MYSSLTCQFINKAPQSHFYQLVFCRGKKMNNLIQCLFGSHTEKIVFARVNEGGLRWLRAAAGRALPAGLEAAWVSLEEMWSVLGEMKIRKHLLRRISALREVQMCVYQPFSQQGQKKKSFILVAISRTEKQTKPIWSHLHRLMRVCKSVFSLRSLFQSPLS